MVPPRGEPNITSLSFLIFKCSFSLSHYLYMYLCSKNSTSYFSAKRGLALCVRVDLVKLLQTCADQTSNRASATSAALSMPVANNNNNDDNNNNDNNLPPLLSAARGQVTHNAPSQHAINERHCVRHGPHTANPASDVTCVGLSVTSCNRVDGRLGTTSVTSCYRAGQVWSSLPISINLLFRV